MTELIWEGKYDEAGRRVAPLRVSLPFQTIETVNESVQQRQAWQSAEFGMRSAEQKATVNETQRRYVEFILQLYHARPITGCVWLHGLNRGRMVHVGSVDAPVSVGDVTNIVTEFKKSIGKGKDSPATNGIDVLGLKRRLRSSWKMRPTWIDLPNCPSNSALRSSTPTRITTCVTTSRTLWPC